VLLTRDNFGRGSSREHAPWALEDYGFCVIIAPSFADIFYNNCIKNGILLIQLKSEEIEQLFQETVGKPGVTMAADLKSQTLTSPTGKKFSFAISAFDKYCMLNGLDQIGWTMQFEKDITKYEQHVKSDMPWLA
jgi:3-isopropylmalate/(R)-2-methylmalate dehydratase small subunit